MSQGVSRDPRILELTCFQSRLAWRFIYDVFYGENLSVCILLILLAFIPQAKGEEIACDSVPKGKYIYVPDSLQNDVMKLLMGNSKVVDDESKFDFSEKYCGKVIRFR